MLKDKLVKDLLNIRMNSYRFSNVNANFEKTRTFANANVRMRVFVTSLIHTTLNTT